MKDVEWLKKYIKDGKIDAEIVKVRKASTVKEAAEEMNCSKKQIIKSIVLVAEDEAIVAIVDGTSSVDLERIKKLIGKNVRVAERDEVLKLTGFPAGGVPPIGHECKVFVDDRVLKNERVYGGGGDEKHLLSIKTDEITKEAIVTRIRK
ncbi:aminoacyl-tRNA deacylase [Archaeoglobales archaeon]|nr:MAG: aminoacyl-tRNA deacylase [Archaeoglobales archaeon]